MTPYQALEAKALDAAYRNLPTDIRMAFPSYNEAITNFANAYHAAMLEGQVVISRGGCTGGP